MIRFACPRCLAVLQVEDEKAGIKRACLACGQRLQVPRPPKHSTVLGELLPPNPPQAPPSILTPIARPVPERLEELDREDVEDDRGVRRRPRRRASRRALDSQEERPHRGGGLLALGIVGLSMTGVGMFSCLLYFLAVFLVAGFVCSLLAWIMGNSDLKKMQKGIMDQSGEGKTKAGRVCGIIGTSLSLVLFCVGLGFSVVVLWFLGKYMEATGGVPRSD
jgi:hypothetical protein